MLAPPSIFSENVIQYDKWDFVKRVLAATVAAFYDFRGNIHLNDLLAPKNVNFNDS